VGMIDLIAFLETESGIEVQHDDVTLDNLDNVSRILAFLASREAG
jgi:acyl carrier protein